MSFDWKSTTFILQASGAATADRLADFKAYLAANMKAGLNTITLFTPVPVDPVSGDIKAAFTPGNAYNAQAKSPEYMGAFTTAAHEVGFKVIWKPQFNFDQKATNNINEHAASPSFNVPHFLAGAKTFWEQWAPAAQRYGADMVVVSTENGEFATKQEAAWRDIIATVRKSYSGLLTYAENNIISRDYGPGPDDIPFWDALDFIGVDAYNPVGSGGSTSYEVALRDFHANQVNIRDGGPRIDIPAVLKALSEKVGKPVFFAEFGIRSAAGASAAPAKFEIQPGEVVDYQEQYNYYKAFLDIYQNQPWVVGVNTWNEHNENTPYPTHPFWNNYFEPFGRLAGDFLEKPAGALLADYWLDKNAPGRSVSALRNPDGSFVDNGVVVGGAGADSFTGLGGTYRAYGGSKTDIAVFVGTQSSFTVSREGAALKVVDSTGKEGSGTLYDVERIKFGDVAKAYDTDGNAGQAYRLYQAAFNRTPDQGGLGYQMKALDDGLSLVQVAQNFINSPEFSAAYGSLNTTQFVTQLYQNVLHRAPDAGGLAYHTGNLDSGTNTRAQVLVGFSESPENQAALIGVIQNGMAYTPSAA